MEEAVNRPVEVYFEDVGTWQRGWAVCFIPAVQRLSVQFPDGSRRLLDPTRAAFRYVEDEHSDAGGSQGDAQRGHVDVVKVAGGDGGGEGGMAGRADEGGGGGGGPGDGVDVEALQAEQAEQEAWLHSVHMTMDVRDGHASTGSGGATGVGVHGGGMGGGHVDDGWGDDTAPVPNTARTVMVHHDSDAHTMPPPLHPAAAADGVPATWGHGPAATSSTHSLLTRGASAEDVAAPIPLAACPLMNIPPGFHRNDADAEAIAAHVWLTADSACGPAASATPFPLSPAETTGLLAISILQSANLAQLLLPPSSAAHASGRGDEETLTIRVCLVQSNTLPEVINPASPASNNGSRRGLAARRASPTRSKSLPRSATTPRLVVPANINPFTTRRTPLYRTPLMSRDELVHVLGDGGVASKGDGGGPWWWQQDVCLCGLVGADASRGSRTSATGLGEHVNAVEGSEGKGEGGEAADSVLGDGAVAAHGLRAQVEWTYLNGYLLFQVMQAGRAAGGGGMDASGSGSALATHGQVIRGQGLIRLCDVFAGMADTYAPGHDTGGLYPLLHAADIATARSPSPSPCQQFGLRLWLPMLPINEGDGGSGWSGGPCQPQLHIAVAIVLPPAFTVPRHLTAATAAPSPTLPLHTSRPHRVTSSASAGKRAAGASGHADARTSVASGARPASSGGVSPRAPSQHLATRPPHPYLTTPERHAKWLINRRPSARSVSPRGADHAASVAMRVGVDEEVVPAFGSAWQAVGAVGLPPHVRPDDESAVRVHVTSLQTVVSGLKAQLENERLRLVRAHADLARWRHAEAMLPRIQRELGPKATLDAGASTTSSHFSSSSWRTPSAAPRAPPSSLPGLACASPLPRDVPALLHLARHEQERVMSALSRLQACVAGVGAPSPPASGVGGHHSADAIAWEIGLMRGRVAAAQQRLRRRMERG